MVAKAVPHRMARSKIRRSIDVGDRINELLPGTFPPCRGKSMVNKLASIRREKAPPPSEEEVGTELVDLLIYSTKSTSIPMRNITMVLGALMTSIDRDKFSKVPKFFVKARGMYPLHRILSRCKGSFDRTPVLRKSLEVLKRLEERGLVRGAALRCKPRSGFCMVDLRQTLFDLTAHSDEQVRSHAAKFQKLRFDIPGTHPSHAKCNIISRD